MIVFATYLLLSNGSIQELARPYSPPGQFLYVLSKIIATCVYLLMWWQIMLGILNKVNTKHHVLLGIGVFFLIIAHVVLFISAVSIRQEELSVAILLPSFSSGYYKSGLSFGVIALVFIFIATVSGLFRKKFQKYWRVGHGFVYLTFVLATVHGLMIGSDVNSGIYPYIFYGAVLSLLFAYIYRNGSLLLM